MISVLEEKPVPAAEEIYVPPRDERVNALEFEEVARAAVPMRQDRPICDPLARERLGQLTGDEAVHDLHAGEVARGRPGA